MKQTFFILSFGFLSACAMAQQSRQVDVLVIGGGTGGTAAGIQAARSGANTLIVEAGPWLGGMLSSAGVSAIDGNHRLPSGIWKEFRQGLYEVYGGPSQVATGWVSNTQFEPHVGDSLFKQIVSRTSNLTTVYNYTLLLVKKKGNKITGATFINLANKQKLEVNAKVTIDATELGDVFAKAGTAYSLGMEAGSLTGENVGVSKTNDIVQDLTYVAVLKDYGRDADCTIVKPKDFDPKEFDGSNTDYYQDNTRKAPTVDGKKMLEYGKLPNGKYMLNWPNYGNDAYLNVVEMNDEQRQQALQVAKQQTLRYIYFIQHTLGYKNLGLADDEFPTGDRLALIPYHREGRRLQGIVRMNINQIADPFGYGSPLYRTGISVGDYPIDHHHKKNAEAPQNLDFYPVPSFNVPLGALIPQKTDGLIVAEKGISVTNVVNGTTRLQPCVMLTGQAAGALAALSVKEKKQPRQVPVRAVQAELLRHKAFLMPYLDVDPLHPAFTAIQKIGATGILKGTPIPFKWANQTWFYPDSAVNTQQLLKDLKSFTNAKLPDISSKEVTRAEAWLLVYTIAQAEKKSYMKASNWKVAGPDGKAWTGAEEEKKKRITRAELAVLLDHAIDPFMQPIDFHGNFIK